MQPSNVIKATLTEPRTAARELLARAQATFRAAEQRAHELLRTTRKSLALHARRVRARARRVGFAAGRAVGALELEKFLDFEAVYARTIASAERDCVELSVALAAEIIGQDLAPNSDLLVERMQRAIGSLLEQRIIRISVHPSHAAMVAERMGTMRGLSVVGDEMVAVGNAVIDTASGRLELDWRAHLESLRQRLLNKVHREYAQAGSATAASIRTINAGESHGDFARAS